MMIGQGGASKLEIAELACRVSLHLILSQPCREDNK